MSILECPESFVTGVTSTVRPLVSEDLPIFCENNKGSDQPALLCRLIRAFCCSLYAQRIFLRFAAHIIDGGLILWWKDSSEADSCETGK